MAKPKWGPGAVLHYEELGTTTEHTECGICGAKNLEETVVLLVHNADLEPSGNMYACDPCAAQATRRDTRPPGGSTWRDDPRFGERGRRRRG